MTTASENRIADSFEAYRPLLFSIAYRMLGSASDAEDMLQEAYLRYRNAENHEISELKAYLCTIVTNLCLDYLKSARVQREQYIGPWLPEPVLTGEQYANPFETAERHESISLAFLVLLESLTPPERAVFLLHEVFDFDYREIGEMIGKSAANCRQLLSPREGICSKLKDTIVSIYPVKRTCASSRAFFKPARKETCRDCRKCWRRMSSTGVMEVGRHLFARRPRHRDGGRCALMAGAGT